MRGVSAVKPVRVLIATTEGPAEVQRISEESPEVQSVICLDGKAVALPVSAAYDAFVREPTGVIERAYGHSAYRMDVSGPISGGLSWQLGALAAHGLFADGRLAGRNDATEHALWLTGEVDRDLNVLPVEHLQEKFESTARLFADLKAAGVPLTICVPEGNAQAFQSDWWAAKSHDWNAKVLTVARATELFKALDLTPPEASRQHRASSRRAPRKRRPWNGLVTSSAAAGVFVLASVGLVSEPEQSAFEKGNSQRPSVSSRDLSIAAVESRRPKDAQSCAVVHFGTAKPQVIRTNLKDSRTLSTAQATNLCELKYKITNSGPASTVWVLGARSGQSAQSLNSKILAQGQTLEPDRELTLPVRVPYRLEETLVQRIAVVWQQPGQSVSQRHLNASLQDLEGIIEPGRWEGVLADLRGAGLNVTEISHSLSP